MFILCRTFVAATDQLASKLLKLLTHTTVLDSQYQLYFGYARQHAQRPAPRRPMQIRRHSRQLQQHSMCCGFVNNSRVSRMISYIEHYTTTIISTENTEKEQQTTQRKELTCLDLILAARSIIMLQNTTSSELEHKIVIFKTSFSLLVVLEYLRQLLYHFTVILC